MNEVPVKSVWQSTTIWLNILAVVGGVAAELVPQIRAAMPVGDPALWSLIISGIGTIFLRLFHTRQPVTVTAAIKPLTAGRTVNVVTDKQMDSYTVRRQGEK